MLTGIIKKVHFNISVKKMDEDLIEKLDNEMNDADAFYYEKTPIPNKKLHNKFSRKI